MTVLEIYAGSNGQATLDLYARLERLGPAGIVALNLFRAQKASARAKVYRRRFKGVAYEKKNWSMRLLCDALAISAAELGIDFGWREDPAQEYHKWVLYVDLPAGQVSFHSATALSVHRYDKPWDNSGDSASRIIGFVQLVLGEGDGGMRIADCGTFADFDEKVSRATCPLCRSPMSDDGCDSNLVYQDPTGVLWEWYAGPWRYGHQTVACRNHHHFAVTDGKFSDHLSNLDGITRGWVLHDLKVPTASQQDLAL